MAAAGKKRDTYVLLGTFIGNKGFRTGDKLRLMFVPDKPKKVECLGRSAKGKPLAKWVDVKELTDLRIVWDGNGSKREGLKHELERILIEAAKP